MKWISRLVGDQMLMLISYDTKCIYWLILCQITNILSLKVFLNKIDGISNTGSVLQFKGLNVSPAWLDMRDLSRLCLLNGHCKWHCSSAVQLLKKLGQVYKGVELRKPLDFSRFMAVFEFVAALQHDLDTLKMSSHLTCRRWVISGMTDWQGGDTSQSVVASFCWYASVKLCKYVPVNNDLLSPLLFL